MNWQKRNINNRRRIFGELNNKTVACNINKEQFDFIEKIIKEKGISKSKYLQSLIDKAMRENYGE